MSQNEDRFWFAVLQLHQRPLGHGLGMGNDGLMSQSSFDVNIKEEDYLTSICPDPYLFLSCMPSDDQLKKHYTKLLEGVIELRQILSRGKTLSAIRRRGELMDLKIADISVKDVMSNPRRHL